MGESNEVERTTPDNKRPTMSMITNDGYKYTLYALAEAGVSLSEVVKQVERDYLTAALRIERGIAYKAAARVRIHRNTFSRIQGKEGGE